MDAMLQARFDRADSVDWILAGVMRECRRRARMSRLSFALALNGSVETYNPGLTAESIEAMEEGRIPPGGDVLCWAMALAGHDVVAALADWIAGAAVRP